MVALNDLERGSTNRKVLPSKPTISMEEGRADSGAT